MLDQILLDTEGGYMVIGWGVPMFDAVQGIMYKITRR